MAVRFAFFAVPNPYFAFFAHFAVNNNFATPRQNNALILPNLGSFLIFACNKYYT